RDHASARARRRGRRAGWDGALQHARGSRPAPRGDRGSLKLLVLGGTLFVGRVVVEAAAAAGHEITLLNRGETNAELFPEVEKLRGDRAGDLSALAGRAFDACIDVNAREADWVRRSLEAVDAPSYLFASSVSAYADLSAPVDESSPTHGPGENYGEQKAEAERLVLVRGGTVVRP